MRHANATAETVSVAARAGKAGHTGHILITTRCHFTPLVHLRPPSRVFLQGRAWRCCRVGEVKP